MNKQIIGAIHFPPMPGYEDYPGFDVALENALLDLRAFENGGVDAVIIENNYDVPHSENISEDVLKEMIILGIEIKKNTKLPVGVSVLWNDYDSAFKIAKAIGGSFIRVPVFVDTVKTKYGTMEGQADNVMKSRIKNDAKDIKIYADIHVKHAEIISNYSISQSAIMAIEKGADVLIVTGDWTGDAPKLEDLKLVREAVGENFPIICGSGLDKNNIKDLFKISDGAIVSTSVKEDSTETHIENVKGYSARVDEMKVKILTQSVNEIQ